MNTNFKRNRTQVKYEWLLGIASVEDLKTYRDQFVQHILDRNDADCLNSELKEDALDFFNNGIISLTEGLSNMCMKRYSWATVKIYYSIFYFLRASMAANNYAILQNGNILRLKLSEGEKPYGTGNSKYKSTHAGTIQHYKDVFGGTDRLLTNKIDDVDVYQWMEEIRNIVNYREVCFLDPDYLDIWSKYDEAICDDSIVDLLNTIFDDSSYVYCFQEDYAVVAVALKRFQETVDDLESNDLLEGIEMHRLNYIENLIHEKLLNIKLLSYIRANRVEEDDMEFEFQI